MRRAFGIFFFLFLPFPLSLNAQTGRCGDTATALVLPDGLTIGSVKVCNDAQKIYLSFTLRAPDARFGRVAAWIGPDWLFAPQDERGPVPEQFRQAAGGAVGDARELREYTLAIPFSSINTPRGAVVCGATFSVLTHAEVRVPNSEGGLVTESAWGGGIPVDNGLHSFYRGLYEVACDFGPPPLRQTQVAYARGTHVLSKAARSNPERLPSLGLATGQGWAIQLTEPGIFVYPLYAAAAHNDPQAGKEAGSVRVVWTGTYAMVTYVAKADYLLEEVRLYATDTKPVQAHPGRFGHLQAFDPGTESYTFTSIPLVDSDRDGVWLIAQATVSGVHW